MSQTSRQGGNDPERDEWLKQFTGLPESSTDDELFNDRLVVERFEKRRADPMTIEGGINAIGEVASEMKSRSQSRQDSDSNDQNHDNAEREPFSSRLFIIAGFGLTTIALVGMVVALVSY